MIPSGTRRREISFCAYNTGWLAAVIEEKDKRASTLGVGGQRTPSAVLREREGVPGSRKLDRSHFRYRKVLKKRLEKGRPPYLVGDEEYEKVGVQ